jgi:hypothetical protein
VSREVIGKSVSLIDLIEVIGLNYCTAWTETFAIFNAMKLIFTPKSSYLTYENYLSFYQSDK